MTWSKVPSSCSSAVAPERSFTDCTLRSSTSGFRRALKLQSDLTVLVLGPGLQHIVAVHVLDVGAGPCPSGRTGAGSKSLPKSYSTFWSSAPMAMREFARAIRGRLIKSWDLMLPLAALYHPVVQEVGPGALGQVVIHVALLGEHRGHQQVAAQHVLAVQVGAGDVLGELQHHGPHGGHAVCCGSPRRRRTGRASRCTSSW